jgi:hypothetical protein
MSSHARQQYLRWKSAALGYAIGDHLEISPGAKLPPPPDATPRITETLFFDALYVHRPALEKAIQQRLETFRRPIVVVGPRGCGKTSVAEAVLRDLDSEGWMHRRIDVAMEYRRGRLDAKTLKQFRTAISEVAREELLTSFFPLPQDRWRLHTMLLQLLAEGRNELLGGDVRLSRALAKARERHAELQFTGVGALAEWLGERAAQDDLNLALILEAGVAPCVRIEHIVLIAEQLGLWREFALFVDNIDQLPRCEYQAACYQYVEDLEALVGQTIHIILAVREENILRPLDAVGRPEDGEVAWPTNPANAVPCVNMPIVEPTLMKEIADMRVAFARRQTPSLSASDGEELGRLETGSAEQFVSEDIIALSNDDARVYLTACLLFDGFVRNHEALLQTGAAMLDPYHVQTLLYVWLVREGHNCDLAIYSLVDELQRWKEKRDGHGCMLNHLAIAVTLNIQNNLRIATGTNYPYARAYEIYSALSDLGYDRDVVRQLIYDLYSGRRYFGHMLGFAAEHKPSSADDVKDSDAVYVTRRGQHLCRTVSNKLSYLVECALVSRSARAFSFEMTVPERLLVDIECLCEIADMHIAGLEHVRDALAPRCAPRPWLDEYKKRYCVLGQLQLHRMLEQHVGHVWNIAPPELRGAYIAPYEQVRTLFDARVQQTVAGGSSAGIRIRDSVNLDVFRR